MCEREIGSNFGSIGCCWLSSKKFLVVNMGSSAANWGLRKLRNELCFQDGRWRDMSVLLRKIAGLLRLWRVPCPVNRQQHLEQCLMKLEWQLNLEEILGESWGGPEMNEELMSFIEMNRSN